MISSIPQIGKSPYLPKQLYHFTPKCNAEEIMQSGAISCSCDQETYLSGVFMVAFDNLKNWINRYVPFCNISLLTALFLHTTKGEPSISCFKIDTDKLTNNIFIRSQQKLLTARENGLTGDFENMENYKLYNIRGDAVEFLYEGDIPVNESNLVGTVDFPESLNKFFNDCMNNDDIEIKNYDSKPNNAAFYVLQQLFSEHPEVKSLSILG